MVSILGDLYKTELRERKLHDFNFALTLQLSIYLPRYTVQRSFPLFQFAQPVGQSPSAFNKQLLVKLLPGLVNLCKYWIFPLEDGSGQW